jgi:glucosamine--fructose-6-phosphate aminotransferase (isomerizing)
MNLTKEKYSNHALCREMLQTADVVRRFDPSCVEDALKVKPDAKRIFLTGEGSSRIFPAKNAIRTTLSNACQVFPFTEGGTQAMDYDLQDCLVLGASNSGKTKEVIRLFHQLKGQGHSGLLSLMAHEDTPLQALSATGHVLQCGGEDAVAATKSVVEQSLYVSSLMSRLNGAPVPSLAGLPEAITSALTMELGSDLIEAASKASTVYFAGRNDGVAEELTLKTNEITRKKSDFLEGTYAVHGIEEVMVKDDVLILINPFESECDKIAECLEKGVGMKVFAISDTQTRFPTVLIPSCQPWQTIIELCAGWNLLVEIGLHLGIDLDKPERARKVGNEFVA